MHMPGYSKSAFFEAIKEAIRDPVPPEVRVCVLVCVRLKVLPQMYASIQP